MDEAKREYVRAWLVKADHDLRPAGQIGADSDSLLDAAIYHCQQCGEKALKCFLALHDRAIPRTHDLAVLAGLAASIDVAFGAIISEAAGLTPFATIYRYPGANLMPTRAEFQEAVCWADAIYSLVLSRAPADLHP